MLNFSLKSKTLEVDFVLPLSQQQQQNSAKRDTQPLKGYDLIHKCLFRGDPKRSFSKKKNFGGGSTFFMGSVLSVAPKSECDITQSSSKIAFYTVLTSSNSQASTTISLVALVRL